MKSAIGEGQGTRYSLTAVQRLVGRAVALVAGAAGQDPAGDRYRHAADAVPLVLSGLPVWWDEPLSDGEPATFSRDEILLAACDALDQAAEHWRESLPDDIDDLILKTLGTLMATPDARFADVVREHYPHHADRIRVWLISPKHHERLTLPSSQG